MLPIATVTETKEDSCIFVHGLSVTVYRLLLLKFSRLDRQQQATSDSKLTSDLAATINAAKVLVSTMREWTQWRTDGHCAYPHTLLVRCMISTVQSQARRDNV